MLIATSCCMLHGAVESKCINYLFVIKTICDDNQFICHCQYKTIVNRR